MGFPTQARAVAAALNARLIGDADAGIARAVHPAEAREEGDLAVAVSKDMLRFLPETKAQLVLTMEGTDLDARFRTVILVKSGRSNVADVTQVFRHRPKAAPGIHPSAIVAEDATIGADVSIGPYTIVGAGAAIGARTMILSQATIAEGAAIGEDCLIYPGVRIGWGCRVGDRAIIHSNATLGADGFGFVPTAPGAVETARGSAASPSERPQRNPLQKIHALSIVEIGDDVEIGALTSIDRGTLTPTRVGNGTKIDDLVMIGHNVQIGTDCMLCGQVGLAGSVVVGDGAVLGGRVGVADHLKIGAGAVVGGGSGVGTNIPAGGVYLGSPAVPREEMFENLRLMRRVKRFLEAAKESKPGGAGKAQDRKD